MAFDPDKYLATKQPTGQVDFDPDAYLKSKEPEAFKPMTYEEMTAPADVDVSKFLKEKGIEPGIELAATLKGAQMGAQVPGTPITKAITGLAGAGLGYAGSKILRGKEQEKPLTERLTQIPEDILTGSAMEAGGQALPIVLSGASKIPGLIKSGVKKILSKPIKVGSRVETPSDIVNVLKTEGEALKPSMASDLENLKYAEEGLAPLTPAQMQPKAMGEPTPAQYSEALLKSRDQGLYQQQLDQVDKYKKILEQYQNMGASTRESAGQQVKEGLKASKKKVGEVIGKFKESGKGVKLGTKKYGMPIDEVDKFALGNDYNKLVDIDKMYQKATTVQELDALSSNVGSQVSEAARAGNNNYARKLGEIKTFLEDRIAETIEKSGISKPKEAYEAYTAANKLSQETLRGAFKTGQSKNVINKITASGENIKQFKNTTKLLDAPELVTTVKENYLSNLFNEATEQYPGKWITKWTKAKKEGIIKELFSPEDIKKIDLLADYYGKMTSTTTKAVNPSRSGIVGFVERVASQPVKSIVNYILGDEMKYAKALKQYKSISASKPGLTRGNKSPIPYMIGRDND